MRVPTLRPRALAGKLRRFAARHPRAPRRAAAIVFAVAAAGLAGSRYGAVYVTGWSMAPAVCPGDLAVLDRGAGAPDPGDVVLVVPGGRARGFVHRVVGVDGAGGMVTRGDANPSADRTTASPDEVRGEVVAVVPLGRGVDALVRAWGWCYDHLPIARSQAMTEKTAPTDTRRSYREGVR